MTHKNFDEFKAVMVILMYFSEKHGAADIENYFQEWYVMYKESKFYDPLEWGEFWFADLNRDTHEHWIDPRGRMLLYLHSRVN